MVVRNTNKPDVKESAINKLQIADELVISDGQKFSLVPESINVSDGKWFLSK